MLLRSFDWEDLRYGLREEREGEEREGRGAEGELTLELRVPGEWTLVRLWRLGPNRRGEDTTSISTSPFSSLFLLLSLLSLSSSSRESGEGGGVGSCSSSDSLDGKSSSSWINCSGVKLNNM